MSDPIMNEVAGVLERAADLIEPEGRWTQGWMARDADGLECFRDGAGPAACWCTAGAIEFVADQREVADEAFSFLRRMLPGSIGAWNDDPKRTQAEVVAKLREAAALSKAQPRTRDDGR